MLRFLLSFLFLSLLFLSSSDGSPSIVGSWQFKNDQIEIVAESFPDGAFRQLNITPGGKETYTGRFQMTGQMLYILLQGAPQPQQITCRFSEADTILATYPTGETLQWKRRKSGRPQEKPSRAPESQTGAAVKGAAGPASSSLAGKRPTLLM